MLNALCNFWGIAVDGLLKSCGLTALICTRAFYSIVRVCKKAWVFPKFFHGFYPHFSINTRPYSPLLDGRFYTISTIPNNNNY